MACLMFPIPITMSLAWQNISMQDLSFKVHVQANLEQFYKENVFAYGHIIGGWGTYILGGRAHTITMWWICRHECTHNAETYVWYNHNQYYQH